MLAHWVNEVKDVSVYIDTTENKGKKGGTPPAITYGSYAYLGYGRIGHFPDISNLIYSYTPSWSNVEIVKNNPIDYQVAFFQMVKGWNV